MHLHNLPVIVSGGAPDLGAACVKRLAAGVAGTAIFDLDAERG